MELAREFVVEGKLFGSSDEEGLAEIDLAPVVDEDVVDPGCDGGVGGREEALSKSAEDDESEEAEDDTARPEGDLLKAR